MTPAWLSLVYTQDGFYQDAYGFTTEDRLLYAPLGLQYLLENRTVGFLGNRQLPANKCYPPSNTSCPMFNVSELKHMQDVQQVTQLLFFLGLAMGVIFVLALGYLWQKKAWVQLRNSLLQGSITTILLLISVAVVAIGAWDVFFDLFHGLFFEDGTWQFYYSDTLIRLYPEQFWFQSAVVLGGISVAVSSAVMGICWRWRIIA